MILSESTFLLDVYIIREIVRFTNLTGLLILDNEIKWSTLQSEFEWLML